jgi:hypothetical protein
MTEKLLARLEIRRSYNIVTPWRYQLAQELFHFCVHTKDNIYHSNIYYSEYHTILRILKMMLETELESPKLVIIYPYRIS